MVPGPWSRHVARAHALAERHPPAAAVLRFYARLAGHQESLAAAWTGNSWEPPIVLQAVPAMLDWLEANGPAQLTGLRDRQPNNWRRTLERYLAVDMFDAADAPAAFVVEALLQPLASTCAASAAANRPSGTPSPDPQSLIPNPQSPVPAHCPFCHQRPAAGVLRDAGQGTRRALVCGLCFTEWGFERIACPSCGERKFDDLPVYTAEQVEGVRVECCDACGVYLKTIDASKDGAAMPFVDDLATITLDLWARERGYRRVRPSFYL